MVHRLDKRLRQAEKSLNKYTTQDFELDQEISAFIVAKFREVAERPKDDKPDLPPERVAEIGQHLLEFCSTGKRTGTKRNL